MFGAATFSRLFFRQNQFPKPFPVILKYSHGYYAQTTTAPASVIPSFTWSNGGCCVLSVVYSCVLHYRAAGAKALKRRVARALGQVDKGLSY